jgi:hypothetical protein
MLVATAAGAAERPPPVQIWYRGSNGCPEAGDFLRRLAALGRSASLARVGDPVDFVVTVANTPERSEGRLERQTRHGTMAIREVSAPRCDDVADGLALSLDLALAPALETPGAERGEEPRASDAEGPARGRLALGAEALLSTPIAPSPLPGLGLFLEIPFGAPALRVALRGQHGESEARADIQVTTTLIGGRLEGCVTAWAAANFSASPCAALDVGWLSVESSSSRGRSDAALWASGSALARVSYEGASPLVLALYAGALVPFVRYELGAPTGAAVFETQALGVETGLGAAWRFQ